MSRQGGFTGKVKAPQPLKWITYAELMKVEAEAVNGVFKPFSQKELLTAWSNLSVISDVKGGVCRALSAVYLCRAYASARVKDSEGDVDAAELNYMAAQDPPLFMSVRGRFFRVFKEGRISNDDYQTLKSGGKVEHQPRPEWESGFKLQGGRGHLVMKKDGKWKEPGINGQPARHSGEQWNVRRMEQVAEAHHDTRFSRFRNEISSQHGKTRGDYEDEMIKVMEHFSSDALLPNQHSGQILLSGPYTDWIWEMRGASQGYFMCWVADHVFAVAIHMIGWGANTGGKRNKYMVKFFDPNYGECKFPTVSDFKLFCGKISAGFLQQYQQSKMDYKMFG